MQKSTKKRGRPAIKPYVERIVGSMVLDEQKKPQEARMPPKVLAQKIQNEIKEHIKQGDHLPALSTLEKRISAYANKNDPQDEPWSIGASDKYNIPFEVVPTLLELKDYLSKQGHYLTVREARWAGRLKPLIQPKILSRVEVLSQWSYVYARWERISELNGTDLDTSDLDKVIKDYAEAWAAYPSLWDTFERQDGFAFTVGFFQYIMELRSAATQRELSKDEKDMLACTEQFESELALVHTKLQFIDDSEEVMKALQMVDKILDSEGKITIESAKRVLGKEDADWLMLCLEKGAKRALQAFGIEKKEALNERKHKTKK